MQMPALVFASLACVALVAQGRRFKTTFQNLQDDDLAEAKAFAWLPSTPEAAFTPSGPTLHSARGPTLRSARVKPAQRSPSLLTSSGASSPSTLKSAKGASFDQSRVPTLGMKTTMMLKGSAPKRGEVGFKRFKLKQLVSRIFGRSSRAEAQASKADWEQQEAMITHLEKIALQAESEAKHKVAQEAKSHVMLNGQRHLEELARKLAEPQAQRKDEVAEVAGNENPAEQAQAAEEAKHKIMQEVMLNGQKHLEELARKLAESQAQQKDVAEVAENENPAEQAQAAEEAQAAGEAQVAEQVQAVAEAQGALTLEPAAETWESANSIAVGAKAKMAVEAKKASTLELRHKVAQEARRRAVLNAQRHLQGFAHLKAASQAQQKDDVAKIVEKPHAAEKAEAVKQAQATEEAQVAEEAQAVVKAQVVAEAQPVEESQPAEEAQAVAEAHSAATLEAAAEMWKSANSKALAQAKAKRAVEAQKVSTLEAAEKKFTADGFVKALIEAKTRVAAQVEGASKALAQANAKAQSISELQADVERWEASHSKEIAEARARFFAEVRRVSTLQAAEEVQTVAKAQSAPTVEADAEMWKSANSKALAQARANVATEAQSISTLEAAAKKFAADPSTKTLMETKPRVAAGVEKASKAYADAKVKAEGIAAMEVAAERWKATNSKALAEAKAREAAEAQRVSTLEAAAERWNSVNSKALAEAKAKDWKAEAKAKDWKESLSVLEALAELEAKKAARAKAEALAEIKAQKAARAKAEALAGLTAKSLFAA